MSEAGLAPLPGGGLRIDFAALERFGSIGPGDVDLMFRTDSVSDAFDHITGQLIEGHALEEPGPRL